MRKRELAKQMKCLAAGLALATAVTSMPVVQADAKPKVKLSKTKVTLTVGKKYKLKLKNVKKNAKIKWSTSNKKVATVSKGTIKAKKAGKAVISAKYGKKKYTCKVTVQDGKIVVNKNQTQNTNSKQETTAGEALQTTVAQTTGSTNRIIDSETTSVERGSLYIPPTTREEEKTTAKETERTEEPTIPEETTRDIETTRSETTRAEVITTAKETGRTEEPTIDEGYTTSASETTERVTEVLTTEEPTTEEPTTEESTEPPIVSEEWDITVTDDGIILDKYKGEKTSQIEIPESICGKTVYKIAKGAFNDNASCEQISIPKTITEIEEGAFKGCTKLEQIIVSEDNENYSSYEDALYNKDGSVLLICPNACERLELPDDLKDVKDTAFEDCIKKPIIVGKYGTFAENYFSAKGFTFLDPMWGVTTTIDGKIEINAYDGDEQVVSIPEKICGKTVTAINAEAFANAKNISKITIPDNVTTIGNHAFMGCTNLTQISISANLVSIGYGAFDGCTNLSGITLPASVEEIGTNVFNGCNSLSTIIVDKDSQTYSSAEGVLYNKDKSELIFIPRAIDKFTVPDTIQIISDKLEGTYSLKSVFGQYGSIADTYFTKHGISVVDKNWSIITNETGVTITKYSGTLEQITVPETANGKNVTKIGKEAFSNIENVTEKITTVILPKTITEIENKAFSGCLSLKQLDVDEENETYKSVNGIVFNTDMTKLVYCPASKTSITLPESIEKVEEGAFNENSNILIYGVYGSYAEEYAIKYNTHEFRDKAWSIREVDKEIEIVGFDENEYTKGNDVIIPNTICGKTVKSVSDGSFDGAKNIESIKIPENLESFGKISNGCTNLKAFIVSDKNKTFASKDGVLYTNDYSSLLLVPTAVTNFTLPDECTKASDEAFSASDKANLKINGHYGSTIDSALAKVGINILDNDWDVTVSTDENEKKNVVSIVKYNGNAENVTMPKTVNGLSILIIDANAFEGNEKMKSIQITDSVQYIKDEAFKNCIGLTEIRIPTQTQFVALTSFDGCTGLNKIIVNEGNENYISKDGVLYTKDLTKILKSPAGVTLITLPEECTDAADEAFELSNKTKLQVRGHYGSTMDDILAERGINIVDPEWVVSKGTDNTVYINKYNGEATNVVVPETVNKLPVVAISGGDGFKDNKKMTTVKIPETVQSLGSSIFQNCTGLTEINIPQAVKMVYVKSFDGCTGLKKITVDSRNENYTSKAGVLYNKDLSKLIICPAKVENIELPDECTEVDENAFKSCNKNNIKVKGYYGSDIDTKLAKLGVNIYDTDWDVSKDGNQSSSKTIVYIDKYNGKDTVVTIPNTVNGEPVEILSDGSFKNTKVKQVICPENLTYIGTGVFENSSVTDVTLGKNVKHVLAGAFRNCPYLVNINVPSGNEYFSNGVYTNVKGKTSDTKMLFSKDGKTLYACPGTTNYVELPKGVTTILEYAFAGCSKLARLGVADTITTIGSADSTMNENEVRMKGASGHVFDKCTNLQNTNLQKSGNGLYGKDGTTVLFYVRGWDDASDKNTDEHPHIGYDLATWEKEIKSETFIGDNTVGNKAMEYTGKTHEVDIRFTINNNDGETMTINKKSSDYVKYTWSVVHGDASFTNPGVYSVKCEFADDGIRGAYTKDTEYRIIPKSTNLKTVSPVRDANGMHINFTFGSAIESNWSHLRVYISKYSTFSDCSLGQGMYGIPLSAYNKDGAVLDMNDDILDKLPSGKVYVKVCAVTTTEDGEDIVSNDGNVLTTTITK